MISAVKDQMLSSALPSKSLPLDYSLVLVAFGDADSKHLNVVTSKRAHFEFFRVTSGPVRSRTKATESCYISYIQDENEFCYILYSVLLMCYCLCNTVTGKRPSCGC
jgi:hypothetical protein